jgi:uncharacterized phosphosugar-binding protein
VLVVRAYERYFENISQMLNSIKNTEKPHIEEAAEIIYNTLSNNGFLYAFGTGHGHMLAEEIFYRAGGLARVRPILDQRFMLHDSASIGTILERDESIAVEIMEYYKPSSCDAMVFASNSGRNAMPVELAMLAKQRGVKTICITSLTQSKNMVSRHRSGKKLYELCDVTIDNHGVSGDACIQIGDITVSPTSTVTGAAIVQSIVAEVVSISHKKGKVPEIFTSSNVDGGDERNELILKKYKDLIISL